MTGGAAGAAAFSGGEAAAGLAPAGCTGLAATVALAAASAGLGSAALATGLGFAAGGAGGGGGAFLRRLATSDLGRMGWLFSHLPGQA